MNFETINIKGKKGTQEITIPNRMKIDDDKAYLKKVGNTLYIIPFHDPWQNLFESIDAFTSDYMNNREQPGNQNRESLDL